MKQTKQDAIDMVLFERQEELKRILSNAIEETLLKSDKRFTREEFESAMEFITTNWDFYPLDEK